MSKPGTKPTLYDCGPRGWMSAGEIAVLLGINVRSVRERIQAGKRGLELVEPSKHGFASRLAQFVPPSVASQQAERDTRVQGETVEEFLARGGRVERLPGFEIVRPWAAGVPARYFAKASWA